MREFFENMLHISDETVLQQLTDVATARWLKKEKLLIEIGEVPTQISFLVSGVLRGFALDENGRDITDCFAYRCGDAAIGGAELQAPSPVNIEALTNCEIVQFPLQFVEELNEQNPTLLLQIYNEFLRQGFARHWAAKRILYHPAMQRYQWFLQEYPGLIDMVCNKHVASFLGMTPVTLSRLRAQLRQTQP